MLKAAQSHLKLGSKALTPLSVRLATVLRV